MCLDAVFEGTNGLSWQSHDLDLKYSGFVVRKKTGYGTFEGLFYRGLQELGVWYIAEERTVKSRHTEYISGFHVFENMEDARDYMYAMCDARELPQMVVVKCDCVGLSCIGAQRICDINRHMRLLEVRVVREIKLTAVHGPFSQRLRDWRW